MAKEIDSLAVPTFDTTKWTEEQVGFAPYWEPEAGSSVICRVVQKEVDPEERTFARYLLQAGEDIKCYRGPADEQEPVEVKKGEFFTISVFYSLQGLFDFYLENKVGFGGSCPWMKVLSVEKRKTSKPGQTVWVWKLFVDPKDRKQADQLRVLAEQKRAKMLAERTKSEETAS